MKKKCASILAAITVSAGLCAPAAHAQDYVEFGNAVASLIATSSNLSSGRGPVTTTTGTSRTITREVMTGGTARTYLIRTPAGYDPNRSYPVVIGFGGWQHSPYDFQGYSLFDSQTGNATINIYPQGRTDLTTGKPAWGGAPYASTSVEQDIQFIRDVTEDAANIYSINKSKVFATGLSNGGGMAAALACKAPDLVAGVSAVASAFYNPTTDNCGGRAVPTLIMHGTNDDVMNYQGGVRHGAPYRSIDAVMRQFQQKNNCTVEGIGQPSSNDGPTTRFESKNCSARTVHVRVNGGGHTWFPSYPSAQQVSWDFFKSL